MQLDADLDLLALHQPAFVMLLVKMQGHWCTNEGREVLQELNELLERPKRFLGLLTAAGYQQF